MIRLYELNKDPAKYAGEVEIAGWVRTVRDSKNIGFIELSRSEERRVGKECRSRWSPYH